MTGQDDPRPDGETVGESRRSFIGGALFILGAMAAWWEDWWGSDDDTGTDSQITELRQRVRGLEDQLETEKSRRRDLVNVLDDTNGRVDNLDTRVSDLEDSTTGSSPWDDSDSDSLLELPNHKGIDVATVTAGNVGARTETYTGDGATTGRLVSFGFEPAVFVIQRNDTASRFEGMAPGSDSAIYIAGGTLSMEISTTTQVHTSADGVVVGDGGTEGNESGVTYHVAAWPTA